MVMQSEILLLIFLFKLFFAQTPTLIMYSPGDTVRRYNSKKAFLKNKSLS